MPVTVESVAATGAPGKRFPVSRFAALGAAQSGARKRTSTLITTATIVTRFIAETCVKLARGKVRRRDFFGAVGGTPIAHTDCQSTSRRLSCLHVIESRRAASKIVARKKTPR